jgi:hypothetical protein
MVNNVLQDRPFDFYERNTCHYLIPCTHHESRKSSVVVYRQAKQRHYSTNFFFMTTSLMTFIYRQVETPCSSTSVRQSQPTLTSGVEEPNDNETSLGFTKRAHRSSVLPVLSSIP